MKKTKRIAVVALNIALAFALSFLESLIPFNFGVPGVKIGLANIVVCSAVYTLDRRDAFFISMVRILLSGLLFSGAFSLLYSFAGGIVSFLVMILLTKSDRFSPIGVCVAGAVSHNLAQIIVASLVMKTNIIVFYFPVLLFTGAAAGVGVGLLCAVIIRRVEKIYGRI